MSRLKGIWIQSDKIFMKLICPRIIYFEEIKLHSLDNSKEQPMQLWRCLTNLAPVPLSRDVVEFKIRNQKGMTWLYFQKPTNL